ncbi:MAG: glycosyltransferase family 4 protein [Candidatus Omnitrophica bacterium]|nr:glycosyltransferase family 4 protein [Candidatus Omnitrophota bacterium]
MFDIWVSPQIKDCDVFTGWSGGCLRSLRAAKKKGIISIVMRTSPHILYQKDILEAEYRDLDIKKRPIFDKIINRELREYDEADYIQVQSKYVFDSFIAKGVDKGKLLHITSGVSLKDFYFMDCAGKKDEFIVLYVGSILVRKGIIYLLEAMKRLPGDKIRLVLIGKAGKEFLMILSQYKKFYTHTGFIRHNELKNYYSRASVFVQPSLSEGLSSAVIEAMACGLPVIITANTGGCDICRDGREGFIVPIRNSEAIAERILYLYNNPNVREEMANNAALRAKEFTWDKCVDRLVERYESITSGNLQIHLNG